MITFTDHARAFITSRSLDLPIVEGLVQARIASLSHLPPGAHVITIRSPAGSVELIASAPVDGSVRVDLVVIVEIETLDGIVPIPLPREVALELDL